MNYTKRYIPVKCLQVKGNKFIPFWLLNYTDHEDYGEGYYEQGDTEYNASHSELTDCIWDVKKKVVILGIIKDAYRKETEFVEGEVILSEETHNVYSTDKIVKIEYEEYDTHIIKFKKMDNWEKGYFTKEELSTMKPDDLYEIRTWKPFYRLASGKLIKWEHQLKHFKQN